MTDNIVWTDVVEKAKAHFSEATFNAFWTNLGIRSCTPKLQSDTCQWGLNNWLKSPAP